MQHGLITISSWQEAAPKISVLLISAPTPVLHYPTVLGEGDELCFMPLAATVLLFSSSPVEPQPGEQQY